MANEHKWGVNPFKDILVNSLLLNIDITENKNKKYIFELFTYILQNNLKDDNDLIYLSFDLKKNDVHYKIVANNIITALWLSGIIPYDSVSVMKNNEFITKKYKYTFDNKNRILNCEPIEK